MLEKKRGGGSGRGSNLILIHQSPTLFNEDSEKEWEESWTAYGNCLQWWGMFTGNNTGSVLLADQCLFVENWH